MTVGKLVSEREFLIQLAVRQFNYQYKKQIDPTRCGVKSIRGNYGCTFGYEVDTIRENDHLRIRVYFNLLNQDSFEPLRLEVDDTFTTNELGDEVYVMIGTVNRYYIDSGTYKFRQIQEDPSRFEYMYIMDGDLFEYMSGEPARYVEKTR